MTDCIEHEGYRDKDGYGTIGRRKAHRVAWASVHGPIPEGMLVLHSCDNPPCVNVNHLHLGTHADNMREKSERNAAWRERAGRVLRENRYTGAGDKAPNRKLTAEQVAEIRRLYRPNPGRNRSAESQQALAVRFGVSQSQISRLVRGEQWDTAQAAPVGRWTSAISDDLAQTIRDRYGCGESQQSLADTYGIGQTTVSRIVRGLR